MSRQPEKRFVDDSLVVVSYSDKPKVEQWYNSVKNGVSPGEELTLMRNESMDIDDFRKAYDKAHDMKKSVSGLTRGECMAVTMYTFDDPMFYARFNSDCKSGSWQAYQVYSALLFSACRKLARLYPVHNEVLYRGLNAKKSSPSSEHFFWPHFTSTSLCKEKAELFSTKTGTLLEFSTCRSGAKIEILSEYGSEHEVLVLPFESFDYLETREATIPEIIFRSSAAQPFI